MRARKLKESDEVEVGDMVMQKSMLGERWWKVSRCTPKYAYVAWNNTAEGKFRRVIRSGDYFELMGSERYSGVQYTVWREVVEEGVV